eukprot:gene17750-24745_t
MSNFLDSSFTSSLNNLVDINASNINVSELTITDSINGITSTQLSYIDPTSSIQTQLDYLKTQTLSTNGGGNFGAGAITSSTQPQGLYIGISCNLISLYLSFNTYPTSNCNNIGCYQNNTLLQTITLSTSQLNNSVLNLNYSFNAGDYINFKTISGSGSVVGRIVSTFTTNGVVGAQGSIGLTPNISIGTVSESSNTTMDDVSLNENSTLENPIFDFILKRGQTGATGSQGIQGEQGIQGIQGIQGEKGDKGDTGNQ